MAATPDPGGSSRPSTTGTPASLADGRYVLGDLLGSGGMGLVYRAHDELLGRDVAVKLLADNLAMDAEARSRFEREARAAARLTHPNVVQVYDVGEEDGRPYFVMEHVDGASLAELLRRRGSLSAREVEDVATQALRGLARAHAAGLLHRDLKPANLMQAENGTVKVTDFGVAQASEMPQMTRTGLVLGTLPYLAPERMRGAPATVRTDLYGFGATLLELLTGRPPDTHLDRDGVEVHGPGDLDTVPPRLTRLVQLCLAKDPELRPASAEAALALLEGDATLPPPPADREPTRVLTAVEEVPTRAVSSDTTATLPAADPVQPAAATAGESPAPDRTGGWTRWLVLGGLAILILVALAQLGSDGGAPEPSVEETPATQAPPADAPAPGGGVPPGDSPAETIRNLGEWIRDRAG